jgi:3-oxoacyl-[acyl-carrier protein] reductase
VEVQVRLDKRVSIVTGGAKGIGGAIASAYSKEGAIVVIPDIDRQALELKQREITDGGGKVLGLEMDVSLSDNVRQLVSETVDRFGRVDILVNNVVWTSHELFLEITMENWQRTLDIALTSYFLCAQAVARQMKAQNSGKIINIGSIAGQVGLIRRAAYSAAKGGILALTRVMAVELARYNIQVNAINPGFIMTDLARRVLSEEERRARADTIPAGHYGTPDEVAGAAVFLACDESNYVNGAIIPVDGGVTCAKVIR